MSNLSLGQYSNFFIGSLTSNPFIGNETFFSHKTPWEFCDIGYKQLLGMDMPLLDPPALMQVAVAGLFAYVSFMLCIRIPLHGFVALQSNVTASCVVDVPLMLLYVTWLTCTPELCQQDEHKQWVLQAKICLTVTCMYGIDSAWTAQCKLYKMSFGRLVAKW